MESEDEALSQLLDALLPSASPASTCSTERLQKCIASLHAAALQSTGSPVPHLEYLSQTLSTLSLQKPITLHPIQHSANTQAILSYLKDDNPSILHVHSPAHKLIFPHHSRCTETFLPLLSHTEAASLIASSLRDAVAAREPVTLIVVHLDETNSLLPALPVAYALADRFNGRVHATGPGCLSAFRGVPLAAHSFGLDIGEALGVRGCGYITFGVEERKDGYGDALLPFGVCVRYVLEKFPLQAIKELLDGVVRVVEGVGDAMYRVEGVWQVDILAEGEARIRYNGENAREVGRAVVRSDETGLLEFSDELLISATSALRRHRTPLENSVTPLCDSLIRVAREYELANLARSAFVARLRQCEHVEVQTGDGIVLCVLSVVPLGQVPPAGRWRTDEDALKIVADCTRRFVEADSDGELLTVMMTDGKSHKEAQATVSPKLTRKMEDGIENWRMAEEVERLAQEISFDETSARSWGVRVADGVVQRVVGVVDGLGVENDDEVIRKRIEDVDEEVEREPDGTVEVVGARERSIEEEAGAKLRGEVATLNGEGDDNGVVRRAGAAPPGDTGKQEELEGHTEFGTQLETDSKAEGTTQNGNTRSRSRPGLWGFIFGENNSTETDSEESSDVDDKQLEDDYFRP